MILDLLQGRKKQRDELDKRPNYCIGTCTVYERLSEMPDSYLSTLHALRSCSMQVFRQCNGSSYDSSVYTLPLGTVASNHEMVITTASTYGWDQTSECRCREKYRGYQSRPRKWPKWSRRRQLFFNGYQSRHSADEHGDERQGSRALFEMIPLSRLVGNGRRSMTVGCRWYRL